MSTALAIFISSSTEDIPPMPKFSIRTFATFGDKNAGRAGDIVVLYAIPKQGYRIGTVKVNGQEIAYDIYGNYQFVLTRGENVVEVTFVAI